MANEKEKANKSNLSASRAKSRQPVKIPRQITKAFSPRNRLAADKGRANNSNTNKMLQKAGGAAGSAAGATIGSVVPVVGTAAGKVIGKQVGRFVAKNPRRLIFFTILGIIGSILPYVFIGLFVMFFIAIISSTLGLIQ